MFLGSTVEKEKDHWSKQETFTLLDIYKARRNEFKTAKKSRYVWQSISSDLLKKGYIKSFESCQRKWKNLIRTYKIVKKNGNITGKFVFYKYMEELTDDKTTLVTTTPSNTEPIPSTSKVVVKDNTTIEITSEQQVKSEKSDKEVNVRKLSEPSVFKKKSHELNEAEEFFKMKKELLLKKKLKYEKNYLAKRRKEERAERKLHLFERFLDIEERRVRAIEEYLKRKK